MPPNHGRRVRSEPLEDSDGLSRGTVRMWDAIRGVLNEMRQNAGEIVVLAFSPDEQTFLTASHDGHRGSSMPMRAQPVPVHHTDAVLCIVFHPDGQSVVTGTRDGDGSRLERACPSRTDSAAEIRRWVKEQTGMVLDDHGAVTTGTVAIDARRARRQASFFHCATEDVSGLVLHPHSS